MVEVALAELLLEAEPTPREQADQVVQLSAGPENDTPVHAALLLFQGARIAGAGAERDGGEHAAPGLSAHKDRPADLLRQIRYERALAEAAMVRNRDSRREFSATIPTTRGASM